jgi:probable phosphoglycerate mutase
LNRKKIYIVRHGQTDFNLKGVVQGSGIDAPINSRGEAQAKAFFEAYQAVDFDHIYYSGLIRTRQSILGFLELGIPSRSLPELNEISWGTFEGTPMTPEEGEYYRHMLAQWQLGNLDYAIAGGESPNLVAQRLKLALEEILSGPGDTILVCMHGRAMRIFLSLILGTDLKMMDQYSHQNLCLYVVESKETAGFQLVKNNETTHLKGLD